MLGGCGISFPEKGSEWDCAVSIHSAQEIGLSDLWMFLQNKVILWFHMLGESHTLNWYSVSAGPGSFITYQMLMIKRTVVTFFQKKISLKYCSYIWHLVSSSRSQKHSYKFSSYFPWQSTHFSSTLLSKSFHDVQQIRGIKRFVDKFSLFRLRLYTVFWKEGVSQIFWQ